VHAYSLLSYAANAYLVNEYHPESVAIPRSGYVGRLPAILARPLLEITRTLEMKESIGYVQMYANYEIVGQVLQIGGVSM
jgi:hypothetical protein